MQQAKSKPGATRLIATKALRKQTNSARIMRLRHPKQNVLPEWRFSVLLPQKCMALDH